jgi:membrane-associated phospholipid phosphatase
MMNRSIFLWCGSSLATATIIIACIRWVDYPVAAMFLGNFQPGSPTENILSGINIITAQLLVIGALAITNLWKGGLPKWANTLLVACTASVLAYTLNDTILKVIFGRINPSTFYLFYPAKFNLFHSDEYCSFPSGHMMLATAFLAVVFFAYSRTWIAIVPLMLLGGVVLVQGEWHYVSDVIAGAFLGFTFGLVTADLWAKKMPPQLQPGGQARPG